MNHYKDNGQLSIKIKLNDNLKNAVWFSNVDYYSFYPKAFSLCKEWDEFFEEFQMNKIETILKRSLLG